MLSVPPLAYRRFHRVSDHEWTRINGTIVRIPGFAADGALPSSISSILVSFLRVSAVNIDLSARRLSAST